MSNGLQPHVEPVSAAQAEAARGLVLTATQALYAGDTAFNVDDAMTAPDSDAMAVVLGRTVIGVHRLDDPRPACAQQAVDRHTMTLRTFALDLAWQGRGLGAQTLHACFADLARRRPDRRRLMLNVHVANTVAAHVDRRSGCVDSGERLPGGPAGPRRLLLRALGVGQCPP